MRSPLRLSYAVLILLAPGCAPLAPNEPPRPISCAADENSLVRDTLYFGRNIPGGGMVTDEEWQRFLDEVLMPRFPQGFTVLEASGQWQGHSGAIERERSKIVIVMHTGSKSARRSLSDIVTEYKARFSQEAVLRDRAATCAAFQ